MGFEIVKESYAGSVKEITIGKGDKAVKVGGQNCYPFYQFEGKMPNKPKIAMEVWDMEPADWAPAALAPIKDVASDPAGWAKKCVGEFGAEMIVLQLKSTDPNDKNASAADAVATVKKVAKAVKTPLIVWGTGNGKKDEEVLKKISEDCQGMNLTLGPVEDSNHKGIGASAMGFGHTIISSSPIDVNLAKQVNILLENLGVKLSNVLIDPTTGGLGYGLEYAYSVMERLRMAAIVQGDDKLQNPIINNVANEVWKAKETKQTVADAPTLGDPEKRGILMEAVGAVAYLMAGSDILIMRHPEAVRLVKAYIDLAYAGGSAADIAPIKKRLDDVDIDLAKIAPKPDLKIEEEKKAAPKPAPKPAPKAEAKPAAAPKAEAPKPAAAPAAAPKAEAPKPAADADVAARVEAEVKARMESEAKAMADADAKVKAEAAAKAKAAAEAKAKADEEARAYAEEIAKREAEVEAVRQKRVKAREDRLAEKIAERAKTETPKIMTPAAVHKPMVENMIDSINRTHRRHVA